MPSTSRTLPLHRAWSAIVASVAASCRRPPVDPSSAGALGSAGRDRGGAPALATHRRHLPAAGRLLEAGDVEHALPLALGLEVGVVALDLDLLDLLAPLLGRQARLLPLRPHLLEAGRAEGLQHLLVLLHLGRRGMLRGGFEAAVDEGVLVGDEDIGLRRLLRRRTGERLRRRGSARSHQRDDEERGRERPKGMETWHRSPPGGDMVSGEPQPSDCRPCWNTARAWASKAVASCALAMRASP